MSLTQKYFNRFELKYQISVMDRDRIIKQIRPFMELDKHVKTDKYNNPGFYEVRSVYYDNPFRKAFFEKINGIMVRYKLRIRFYPDFEDGDEEIVFIEVKSKYNENVAKSRVIVPFEKAFKIVDETTPEAKEFYKNASYQDKLVLNGIWYLYKRFYIVPVCVVCYKRQPYMAKIEKTFRITFDTDVKIRDYNFDLHVGGGRKYVVPPHICVMEIKFNSFIPNWAIRLIQRNECIQLKISKFVDGLKQIKVYSVI